MEALEGILKEIGDLEKDLGAVIVVQEESEHYERGGHYPSHNTDVDPFPDPRVDRLVVSPAVTKPHIKKREAAKKALQEIYESSGWYSARYAAGVALDIGPKKLKKQIGDWVYGLVSSIDSSRLGVPNARLNAVRDAGKLFEISNSSHVKTLLEQTYGRGRYPLIVYGGETSPFLSGLTDRKQAALIRSEAGRALGYSGFRIWKHEHPALTGLAISAVLGLGYVAVQYLSR